LEAHIRALNDKYSAESLDKKVIAFMERISNWKGGATLGRAQGKAVETKKLHVYFRAPASAKPDNSMDVDDGESSSDDSDSQSDVDSDDDRTPPARIQPLSAASKRPRASSLSDNVQTASADNQTSPPPLKKERLGVPA
jgi:hypothetical protein